MSKIIICDYVKFNLIDWLKLLQDVDELTKREYIRIKYLTKRFTTTPISNLLGDLIFVELFDSYGKQVCNFNLTLSSKKIDILDLDV